jgi:hypothetical protein
VTVRLTDAGRTAHDAKDAAIRTAWDAALEGAEPGEAEAIASALRRVAALYDSL